MEELVKKVTCPAQEYFQKMKIRLGLNIQNIIKKSINIESVQSDILKPAQIKELNNRHFKVVVLGDTNVGKTTFCKYFAETTNFSREKVVQTGNSIIIEHRETIGFDIFNTTLTINNILYSMQLYDVAGNKQFRPHMDPIYLNTEIFVFMFDITNYESFDSLKKIIIQQRKEFPTQIPCIIIGTKTDLSDIRPDMQNECKDYADSLNMTYIEISITQQSRTNIIELHKVFNKIAMEIIIKQQ
jgi:small GTP-binding protein